MQDPREMILRQQAAQQQQRAMAAHMPKSAAELPDESPEPSMIAPILRQWWLVLAFGVVGIGAAYAYIQNARPLFSSYAKIYIRPTPGTLAEVVGVNERGNFLSTQTEIIMSRPILEKALEAHPELKKLRTFIPAEGDVIGYLRETLDVQLERKTDLINIEMYSPYPNDAKEVVDAVVEAYITEMERDRNETARKVLVLLQTQLTAEAAEIEALQKERAEYMHLHPTATLKEGMGNVDDDNLRIVMLRKTEREMALFAAEATWGADHKNVRVARQELLELKRLETIALERLRAQKDASSGLALISSRLDQKIDLQKQLREKIQKQELETTGRKLVTIEVVEPALVAAAPSYPRPNRTMAVAIVSGMLIGAGLALLRDRLDGRMKTIEEIQTVVGLPILGVVPAMTGRRTAIARAMAVHLDPRSPVAEAYRTIRTAVFFGSNGTTCKTLLITSPEPGDGKTTSASNLAIAIAQTGRSVLLLDADFRKPTQHKNLDVKDAVGLSSVLAGRESLEQAIQHTGVEGLDILPCGPIPANPSEILNSREFGELVDSLAARYDHILFDSPPVNRVTDARILGAVCDATILVLRANQSTRKAGEHARNALLGVGARVLGAIVNSAPHSREYEVYGGSYYGAVEVPATRRIATTPPAPAARQDSQRRRNIA